MSNYVKFDEEFFSPCPCKVKKVSYHLYCDCGLLDEVYKSKAAVHKCMEKFFVDHPDIALTLDSYMLNRINVYSVYCRRRFISQYYLDHPEEFGMLFDDQDSLSARIAYMNSNLPYPIRKLLPHHGI